MDELITIDEIRGRLGEALATLKLAEDSEDSGSMQVAVAAAACVRAWSAALSVAMEEEDLAHQRKFRTALLYEELPKAAERIAAEVQHLSTKL